MNKELLHDKIEAYLLGQLSTEENNAFASKIATDADLAAQVDIQRVALLGLERLAEKKLQAQFSHWDKALDVAPTASMAHSTSQNIWRWMSAISLVLLAICLFFLFQKTTEMPEPNSRQRAEKDSLLLELSHDYLKTKKRLDSLLQHPHNKTDSDLELEALRLRQQLSDQEMRIRQLNSRKPSAASHAMALNAAPAAPLLLRGNVASTDPILQAAIQAFKSKNYPEAERLLKSVPSQDPRYSEVLLLLPQVLFYSRNFEEAIPLFFDLKEKDQFEKANAEWFLTLCFVAEKRNIDARWMIEKIRSNPNHPFYQDAEMLRKKID